MISAILRPMFAQQESAVALPTIFIDNVLPQRPFDDEPDSSRGIARIDHVASIIQSLLSDLQVIDGQLEGLTEQTAQLRSQSEFEGGFSVVVQGWLANKFRVLANPFATSFRFRGECWVQTSARAKLRP
jgi:hypothetical protein